MGVLNGSLDASLVTCACDVLLSLALISIGIGVAKFAGVCVAMLLIPRVGRRTLLMAGTGKPSRAQVMHVHLTSRV